MQSDNKGSVISLEILKKLLNMIEKDATGFDLAYEIEQNKLKNMLLHDGISFYNAFLRMGNQRVKDVPDKKKTNYHPFKLIEYTEKYLIIEWLKKTIKDKEKNKNVRDEYAKYIKSKSHRYTAVTICKHCGASVDDENQRICENCGEDLY